MNIDVIEKIANAVLYEGYLLYPYRASAVKNQQRFNFGVLYPRQYSELQSGSDLWEMQTECLIEGDGSCVVEAKVRFLQLVTRESRRKAVNGPSACFLKTWSRFNGARCATSLPSTIPNHCQESWNSM